MEEIIKSIEARLKELTEDEAKKVLAYIIMLVRMRMWD